MGLYSIHEPYGLSTWYENNGAYDLNTGTDLLLDLPRHILESDAYIFQGVSFPKGNDIFVEPQQSYSGVINLIPFSYIVGLTGWSGNKNAFTLRIYDRGAQTDLYFRQFAWYPTVLSNMTGSPNMGKTITQNDQNQPFGPYFFRAPLIVLPPGILQIQLTNIAKPDFASGGIVQLLFSVAVPKNTVSLNNRRMTTPQDPSGIQSLQGTTVSGGGGAQNGG
jgi:hypothetical protein